MLNELIMEMGLVGDRAESFEKVAEDFDELFKLAGAKDGFLKGIAKKVGKNKEALQGTVILAVATGIGMKAASDSLFSGVRSNSRFKHMMNEAQERGYSDITDSPDQEAVRSAFKLVDAYMPTFAADPLLAAGMTKYLYHQAVKTQGGINPEAIANMAKAQDKLNQARPQGISGNDIKNTSGELIGAIANISTAM